MWRWALQRASRSRRSLQGCWRGCAAASPGAWKSRLLALAREVPEDHPSGRATPVLESSRVLRKLEEDRAELQRQRDAELVTPADKAPAAELAELAQLYDSELEAAADRILAHGSMLEQELLLFQRAAAAGERLSDADSAAADGRDAMLELSPGVGGQEAALFTGELLEMYERFAESRAWQFEVESMTEGQPTGAVLSASVRITGSGDEESAPFGWLRHESGVHRVQRVPATERKGRMQTSSATVVVLPVAVEADVSLGPNDVRIEISKKSSGPGGQSVNAAHQAIRATHIPSGLTVHCSSSQSQFENKIRAVEMLRTKLLDQQLSARSEFERSERKEHRGTGDRSEKIRTYNFQRDECTDHRLAKDEGGAGHSADGVIFSSGLEALILAHRQQARLQRLDEAARSLEAELLPQKLTR